MENKLGFLDRPVRRRWMLYASVVLVLVGLLVIGFQSLRNYRLATGARESVKNAMRSEGEAVARTIAVISHDDVVNRRYDRLQSYFTDLVGQQNIRYLALVTPDGKAVVHTDAKYLKQRLDDEISTKAIDATELTVQDSEKEKLFDVAVPVMGYTTKLAVVRVGISYARSDALFR
jgi:hypothetical protein